MRAPSTILFLVILFNGSSLQAQKMYPPGSFGQGRVHYIDTIPVAIFQGTPREIGEQQAVLLAKPGAEVLQFPRRILDEFAGGFFWPIAVAAANTMMENAPERFRQEIDALVAHADLDANTIAVANTMLELSRVGCSALIVQPERSATHQLLFGRNFDFPAFGLLDRYALVKVIRPVGKHSFVEVGFPGLLGVLSGMNDAGLCVATLDVYETGDGSVLIESTGTPMMLVFRQILEECTTLAEAEALLSRTQATTRANLAVCDRTRGAVFEITPKQVARRDADEGLIPCTNHFCIPGLSTNQQCWRYDLLGHAQERSQLSVHDIQGYLHQTNQDELTLQTMIFEPQELVLYLSLGSPPSSGHPMHRLEFQDLITAKASGDK